MKGLLALSRAIDAMNEKLGCVWMSTSAVMAPRAPNGPIFAVTERPPPNCTVDAVTAKYASARMDSTGDGAKETERRLRSPFGRGPSYFGWNPPAEKMKPGEPAWPQTATPPLRMHSGRMPKNAGFHRTMSASLPGSSEPT